MPREELYCELSAFLRFLDLEQMPCTFDEAVVIVTLDRECLIGRASSCSAFHVRIASDQLDRACEFGCVRP